MLISGSILTMLAIGFAVLAAATGERRFAFPAVIVGSVGIGLVIGAAIARRFSTKKELVRERP